MNDSGGGREKPTDCWTAFPHKMNADFLIREFLWQANCFFPHRWPADHEFWEDFTEDVKNLSKQFLRLISLKQNRHNHLFERIKLFSTQTNQSELSRTAGHVK
jgi:hypothetical protein